MSSPDVDLVTPAEADEFLESVLQLESPLDQLSEDRAGFLDDLVAACHRRVPFQTLTAIATPRPERRRLTFREIKADMLARLGGLCCELNYFLRELLATLGFEARHVACTVRGSPNSHLSTVVKHLTAPGDLHLVDVGTGYPMFDPIPLDFREESPLYKSSFLRHKFLRDADAGTLRWEHRACRGDYDGPPGSGSTTGEDWHTFMTSDLEARDVLFFHPSMENVHTVESGPEALAPFLLSPRAVDYRGGRLVAIKDTKLLEEDAGGQVRTTRLSSPEELLEAYRDHFPQFPQETVRRAIQTVELIYER